MEASALVDGDTDAFMRAQEIFSQASSHEERIIDLASEYTDKC